jgi:hypothetical protein
MKRETMDTRTKALLDRADGALDVADMGVGSRNVQLDGTDLFTDAGKLLVGMDVTDSEATDSVEVDDSFEFAEDGVM